MRSISNSAAVAVVDGTLSYRGREITDADVAFVKQLIAEHPAASRRALSKKLCQAWGWVQPNGVLRDMVCRGLMLELHRRGRIELPPVRYVPPNNPRILCRDWPRVYGHPVHFAETFVDPGRFRGTCYRAANWVDLGWTTGRGKDDQTGKPNRSLKQVLGYPLPRRFRERLGA